MAAPLPSTACVTSLYSDSTLKWITIYSLLFKRVMWPEVVEPTMGVYCLSPPWGRTRGSVTGCPGTLCFTSFDFFG